MCVCLCACLQVQAAQAYDRAAIQQKGIDACTNFHLSNYVAEGLLSPEQVSQGVARGILQPEELQTPSPTQPLPAPTAAAAPPPLTPWWAAPSSSQPTPSSTVSLEQPQTSARTLSNSSASQLADAFMDVLASPQTVLLHLQQELANPKVEEPMEE